MIGLLVIATGSRRLTAASDDINAAGARDELMMTGVVVARVKGGLSVDIGVKAFLLAARSICAPSATWTS